MQYFHLQRRRMGILISMFLVLGLVGLVPPSAKAAAFAHPGILHSAEDLLRMKNNQNTEPWKSALTSFMNDSKASSSYSMQGPYATVCRKDTNLATCTNQNDGNTALENDSRAAYYNALLWNVTGNQAYANKAIQILDAWSGTLTNIAGTDAQLAAGDNGIFLANAGELLRYSNSGWSTTGIAKLEQVLVNVFYPPIAEVGDANWGGSCLKTMISIAVFTNNQTMFENVISHFRTNACAALTKNVMSTGQISESGRDQPHALGGLGNLIVVAQAAWNQGIDLYSDADNRLLTGTEYWSNYNLGNAPTSYDTTYGRCTMGPWSTISATGRSATYGWAQNELIYAHYVSKLGMSAPFTTTYMNGMPSSDPDAALLTFAYRLGTITDTTNPTTPTNLTGTPISTGMLHLNWTRSTDNIAVKGYNIYRNGTMVGSTTSTDYTDKGLAAGATYTYTVRAYDGKGNISTASSSFQGTTLSSTTSQIPFQSSDIGSVGLTGNFSYSGGVYTLKASGSDIWNKTDELRFAFVPLKGNGTIIARVTSLTNTHSSAKAGVMVRESLLAFGSNAYVALKPSQVVFQNRTAPGAATSSITAATQAAPYWVKAVRTGDTVAGYVSADGLTWTQAGSSTISSASTAYIGLAATSHDNTKLTTAVFDNVTIQQ